jgi:hypothetical protein
MRVLSAVVGLAALMFLAILLPDYFPYMRLLLGLMACIFALVIIASDID